jgi:transcriptional regulator with XRE-family HTH domain
VSKKETVFPLNTFGGRMQDLRKNRLKISRPEFYDLIYPNGNVANESKSRTVKNWESGECEPDLRTIQKICTALKCSSDYLLGLDNCTTKDAQFIHDKTGLSEKAIELLIDWNEKTKLPHDDFYRISISFFSDLLECCGIQAVALAQNVSNYLFYRKISETENLTSKITKDKYDKYEIARVRASYKFMDCLEYIYAHSKNIPTKEELQKKYPRTEEEKLLDEILG